jgi:hypothetical protein
MSGYTTSMFGEGEPQLPTKDAIELKEGSLNETSSELTKASNRLVTKLV